MMAGDWVAAQAPLTRAVRVCIGTTDVHEHGKFLVEEALAGLGAGIVDAGVAVDPEVLVEAALAGGAEAIAISTYNGVAMSYARAVLAALAARGAVLPVLIGGKLNEIPPESNSGLPVDVTADLAAAGCSPCAGLDEMLAVLRGLAAQTR